VLAARLTPLMLQWTDFFLFWHGENGIDCGAPPRCVRRQLKKPQIFKKNAFWPLTVLFR
jgi:hypothetical protein